MSRPVASLLFRLVVSVALTAALAVPALAQGSGGDQGGASQEDGSSTSGPGATDSDEYSVDGYQELEAQLGELDLARVATEPGSDARVEATEAAIAHRRTVMNYITGWLRAGTVPAGAEGHARDARLILVENIVQLSVEIGRCDDARTSLALIEEFGRSEDPTRQRAYQSAVQAVAGCEDAEPDLRATDEPEDVAGGNPDEEPGTIVYPQPEPARARNPLPAVLIGAGSAAVVGGVVWNIALLGDRSEFRDARDACEEPGGASAVGDPCGTARSLASTLDGAKAPVAALVVGGAALATVGTVLQLRNNRADRLAADARVGMRLDPVAGPGVVGATAEIRWGRR